MSRQSRRYIMVAILLLIISIARVGASYDPLRDFFHTVSEPIAELIDDPNQQPVLEANSSLETQNQALQDQLNTLRQELGLPATDIELLSADVTKKDVSGQRKSIWVNRGSREGVKVDASVLSGGFLIGRVVEVANNWAEVIIFGDPSYKVSASTSQTNGIVSTISGSTLFDLVPSKDLSGQVLVTDGIDGRSAPGIVIGEVGPEVSSDGVFSTYQVRLGINPSQVQNVQIEILP